MFVTREVSEYGVYMVRFTKNGQKFQTIVDDWIPCNRDNRPAFSQSHQNDLWVLLLEKAWAKIHGSYDRIRAGSAYESMRDLTGAPSYEYILNDTREGKKDIDLFDKISEAESKNWIVGASTHVEDEQQR